MTFGFVPPWWLAAVLAVLVAAAVWAEYRRPLVPLSRARRFLLSALRGATLVAVIVCVFRPIAFLPPAGSRDALVPVIVDVSRSMRLADADGQARIARATSVLKSDVLPSLARAYRTPLLAADAALSPVSVDALDAHGTRSDLTGALARVRERFRGDRVAGIVLVSDGADTGGPTAARHELPPDLPPVFAVGVGSTSGLRDREVVAVAAGDQRLDGTAVELQVSTASSGFARTPFELRLVSGGRVLEQRRVTPRADGSPNGERFTVYPPRQAATVYTFEIPGEPDERVLENNARSVLVSPAGRKRRLLVLEGAPGFEHSFMTRAWAADSSLEVDSVVRKGRNAAGASTFSIQAAAERTPPLATGFPARREDLYAYDVLVLANIEGEFFTQGQLSMIADFVSERGGGLLVAGGRSLAARGLIGTPIEPALPVELDDRRGGAVARASLASPPGAPNQVVPTTDGEVHPVMRLGRTADDTRQKWAALPALASLAALGPPRAGATVLAVSSVPGGGTHPVVAVQKYGRGRSMVFGGEASWRWRMMMASTDRSYEVFWRQASRWLAEAAPEPLNLTVPEAIDVGEPAAVEIDARDASFAPIPDANVSATLVSPDGTERSLALRRGAQAGRSSGAFVADGPGAYHVRVEATRGGTPIGRSDRWILAGGVDREFADPRLNEAWLRRVARATGGRYVRAADASRVVSWLQESSPANLAPERRDLWHHPLAFALVVFLLAAEWILRRAWGLR